jgi:hypothetical protein
MRIEVSLKILEAVMASKATGVGRTRRAATWGIVPMATVLDTPKYT